MITFYCRLAKAALLALRQKRISVGEATEISWRCLPSECEDLQTMNGSRIINAAEVSSHYNNLRNGFFQSGLSNGLFALTKRYHVEFRKPVFMLKKLVVRSRMCFWNEKAVFWHHQIFQKGELCCEIYSEVRVRSKKGAISPLEAQEIMGVRVPSPSLPDGLDRAFSLSV